MTDASSLPLYPHRHLLGISDLSPADIELLLDRADRAVAISRQSEKKTSTLRGRTQINLFYEASTRTQSSFELAGKRLGADVMNMVGRHLLGDARARRCIDTAMTLNAMRPDVIVVRHHAAGAVNLLSQKVELLRDQRAATVQHEHPDPGAARRADHPPRQGHAVEADRRDLRRHPAHARGAAPTSCCSTRSARGFGSSRRSTLLPTGIEKMGVSRHAVDAPKACKDADVVMMLRLQRERMDGAFVPSLREYFRYLRPRRRKAEGRQAPTRW